MGVACQQRDSEQTTTDNVKSTQQTGRIKIMRKRPAGFVNTAAPAGAHLDYWGGPVISNVKVVQVLYGSGTYIPEVSGAQMGNFYQQFTNSALFDWLPEYNTNITAQGGIQGTNQQIGKGSFVQQIQITPSAANSGTNITDAQISAELTAQINAGHLPQPDANTLYMTNFPQGVNISLGGTPSCQAGGFCAYHSTATLNGNDFFYGVLPDQGPQSGCFTGCGSNATTFANQTEVASHELIEAVTDCAVGLATTNGPPLAWYDQTNGEIGDICNGTSGTFVGSDGVTYTAQLEFDNATSNCIFSKGTVPDAGVVDTGPAPDSGPADTGVQPDAGQTDAGGNTCSHSDCTTGGPLTSGCNSCVTQICSQDPFCCATQWDNICVSEVGSICGQSCTGGNDGGVQDAGGGNTCSHPVCKTGKKLNPNCSTCAGEVCAQDPYCCAVKWDSICVSEVPGICGSCQ
jgi:hypothetical protein